MVIYYSGDQAYNQHTFQEVNSDDPGPRISITMRKHHGNSYKKNI